MEWIFINTKYSSYDYTEIEDDFSNLLIHIKST